MHPLGKNPQSPYLLFVYMLPAGLVAPGVLAKVRVRQSENKKPPEGGLA
jgi:hypothetical protein